MSNISHAQTLFTKAMSELVAINAKLMPELREWCDECDLTESEFETMLSFDGDVQRRDIVQAGRYYSALDMLSQKANMYQWCGDYTGYSKLILTDLGSDFTE